MVKFLRHFLHGFALFLSVALLVLVAGIYWLHASERSLEWAKPWVVSKLNNGDLPYRTQFNTLSITWNNVLEFGHLRMSDVVISRPDGATFASLPYMEVTLDPIGFLPGRSLLKGIWLNKPRIYLTRDEQGVIQLGLEGAAGATPLRDLFVTANTSNAGKAGKPFTLPFRKFFVSDASLDFSDVGSGTALTSKSFAMALSQKRDGYHARLVFPFQYEEAAARLDVKLSPASKSAMQLDVGLTRAPAKLLCVFGLCPDGVDGDGPVNGAVGLTLAPDGTPLAVQAALTTDRATITAPKFFDKPLKLGQSKIEASSTAASHTIMLTALNLKLEDTTITATGSFHHEDEIGWTVALDAAVGALDVTKVKHYWPLPLAPESREWVTSKMKSGTATAATLQARFRPEDFSAPAFPDDSIAADVDARDVTFEYLPGFPEVKKMSAKVHFTGRTIDINGGGGTLLSGTTIPKARLWMPDVLNPHNPMEATFSVAAPASDIATLLALKHFTFEDAATLNPETIKGSATADISLKFDSFSNKKLGPDEVNFGAVDYDIAANLQSVAQEKFAGGYKLNNLSGALKAKNGSTNFNGSVAVGAAPAMAVDLTQADGKPTKLKAKTTAQASGPSNDFELSYEPGSAGSRIDIKGRELDATASYDSSSSGSSVLKNFPALQLSLALDRLWLSKTKPLSDVNGSLNCSAQRCESANFSAVAGKGGVRGGISQPKGQRQFSLVADNAGDFLEAVDMTDRLKGGKLELSGPYDDSKTPPALTARLLIRDFTLINSEILGRILSIASLTGIQNLLTGSGISFEKMSADIRSQAGVIGVSKGKANGASIGLTIEGEIDTASSKMAMKGVVVPAYALNSILNNLPIIGTLVGGDGEGLVAFNYSIGGTFANPDVSVNPLSGLTPGFLRGIFGVFDSGADKVEKTDKPAKKASGAPTVKNR